MEPQATLNNLDYIVIGVVLLSGLLAMMRGLLRELVSLAIWVGAYFAAVKYYRFALPTVHDHIHNEKAAEWTAIAIVFFAALIAMMIVGSFICRLIRGRSTLTAIDRSLGFVYGLARGALVLSLIYMAVTLILWPDADTATDAGTDTAQQEGAPPVLLQAKTRPALAYGANLLKAFVPNEMIGDKLQDTDEEAREHAKEIQQKMLDKLSTPALPTPGASDQSGDDKDMIGVGKLFNKGN